MATPARDLLTILVETGLLSHGQEEFLVEQFADRDSGQLLAELLGRGWLTRYQAQLIGMGRLNELVLGSYVIQDRLGNGGMGDVFKAWQRRLERLVAIKLIRKDRLSDSHMVMRFRREARAAA